MPTRDNLNNRLDENDFLGRGFGFPVEFDRDSNEVRMSEGVEDITESIGIIVNTIPGERILRPLFGANAEELIFEPLTITSGAMIANEIRLAIVRQEPRVIIEETDVDVVQLTEEGRLDISISFTVIAINTRFNKVFPFFINEATEL